MGKGDLGTAANRSKTEQLVAVLALMLQLAVLAVLALIGTWNCTAAVKMSTLLRSSQENIGYVAAGRGGNIPSAIGMVHGGIICWSACTIVVSIKCVIKETCWRCLFFTVVAYLSECGQGWPEQYFVDTLHQNWSKWKTNRIALIPGRFRRNQLLFLRYFPFWISWFYRPPPDCFSSSIACTVVYGVARQRSQIQRRCVQIEVQRLIRPGGASTLR